MATKDIPRKTRMVVVARELHRCLRCATPIVAGEMHHRRSRSIQDGHQHCTCNLVWLCRTCHRWAHAHPLFARQDGWIVARHVESPGTQPVTAHFAALLLRCDGGYDRFHEERQPDIDRPEPTVLHPRRLSVADEEGEG